MRISRLLFAGLLPVSVLGWGSAAAGQDAPAPKPEFVLIEMNPWLMVVGSDAPEFAIYDDGLVIYRTGDGYRAVRLDQDERTALLHGINLAGLQDHYEATHVTDQRTNIFIDFRGQTPIASQVYGSLAAEAVRAKVPEALPLAYDRMHNFDHPDAIEWVPEQIEVMIWPYDYAPEASIHWPSDWPGLDDASTRKRGEDSYSLYLPSSQLGDLKAFLSTRNAKGAVEIGGKKWAVSTRYPFPSDTRWIIVEADGN
jgi:hypothetical protein